MTTTTMRLLPEETKRIDSGDFVRLDLPARAKTDDGSTFTSVLVARRDGELRVFANVCRHQAIPLDARAPDPEDGVLTDDKRFLLCHAHGAIYRPTDGLCVSGPCMGTSLAKVAATETDAGLVLELEVAS